MDVRTRVASTAPEANLTLVWLCQDHATVEITATDSDEVRVPAAPSTDDDSLRELVDAHARPAFRLALGIVRDPALAEDVVQEAMVKVWRSLHTFRGESSIRSWIMGITHNTAVSMLRKVKDVATDPHDLPEQTAPIGPARQAAGRLAIDALDDALGDLDPLSRSVVVLREIEGMAYEAIADTLDVPVTTVKTRLFRARRRLLVEMEAWT